MITRTQKQVDKIGQLPDCKYWFYDVGGYCAVGKAYIACGQHPAATINRKGDYTLSKDITRLVKETSSIDVHEINAKGNHQEAYKLAIQAAIALELLRIEG